MSYCRWSSDNWKSDVYCYEDVSGGWTTHVAGSKRVGIEALPPGPDWLGERSPEEFALLYNAHMAELEKLELVPIGLPHDGETFNDASLAAFRTRLQSLKDAGYHVPDYVFDTIAEEIEEANHAHR